MVSLASRLTTDLTRVFSTGDLAVSAQVTHYEGAIRTFPCHFEQEWTSAGASEYGADVGYPQEVFIGQPALVCRSFDLLPKTPYEAEFFYYATNPYEGMPAVGKGDVMVIDGVSYKIRAIQADGTGTTVIRLWQP